MSCANHIHIPYSSMSILKSSPESNCLQGGPGAAVTLCRVTGDRGCKSSGERVVVTPYCFTSGYGRGSKICWKIPYCLLWDLLVFKVDTYIDSCWQILLVNSVMHVPFATKNILYNCRGLSHLDSRLPDAPNFHKNNSLPDDIFSKLKYFLKMSNYFRFVAPGVCNKMSFSVIK